MKCSNCGSIYQIKSIKSEIGQKGVVYCEVCGHELLSAESANQWTAILIERFEHHKSNAKK